MEQQNNFSRHPEPLRFDLKMMVGNKTSTIKVVRTIENESLEKFVLIGADRSIILTTNRRFLKTLMKPNGQAKWTIESGKIRNMEMYEEVVRALEHYMNEHEKKYPVYQYGDYLKWNKKKK